VGGGASMFKRIKTNMKSEGNLFEFKVLYHIETN
jgi:hypothetical protein